MSINNIATLLQRELASSKDFAKKRAEVVNKIETLADFSYSGLLSNGGFKPLEAAILHARFCEASGAKINHVALKHLEAVGVDKDIWTLKKSKTGRRLSRFRQHVRETISGNRKRIKKTRVSPILQEGVDTLKSITYRDKETQEKVTIKSKATVSKARAISHFQELENDSHVSINKDDYTILFKVPAVNSDNKDLFTRSQKAMKAIGANIAPGTQGVHVGHTHMSSAELTVQAVIGDNILSREDPNNKNKRINRTPAVQKALNTYYSNLFTIRTETEAGGHGFTVRKEIQVIVTPELAAENVGKKANLEKDAKNQLLRDLNNPKIHERAMEMSKEALKKLGDSVDLENLETSRTFRDLVTTYILASWKGKKPKPYKYAKQKKAKVKAPKVNVRGRSSKASITSPPVTVEREKEKVEKEQDTFNPTKLKNIVNKRINDQVRRNMGSPKLNNRTGRFASSVFVDRVTQGRKGMITFYYDYMKSPYQTFEVGFKQGTRQRDPRPLIADSIRDIATDLVDQRFRSVRVNDSQD